MSNPCLGRELSTNIHAIRAIDLPIPFTVQVALRPRADFEA